MQRDKLIKAATEALSQPPEPGNRAVSITMKLYYLGVGRDHAEAAQLFGISEAALRALINSNPEYQAAWDFGGEVWDMMHDYWETLSEHELDALAADMNQRLNPN